MNQLDRELDENTLAWIASKEEDLPEWHEESPSYKPPARVSDDLGPDEYDGRYLDEFRGLVGEERFSTYGNHYE